MITFITFADAARDLATEELNNGIAPIAATEDLTNRRRKIFIYSPPSISYDQERMGPEVSTHMIGSPS
jgi:hypothetical protein